ncbi:MAG: hypothetical protein OEZ54_10720 [Gemmatimonadota bacterium]|nr:hypothetical protein [Gemmatimonadota bacterium]
MKPVAGFGLIALSLFMMLGYFSSEVEATLAVRLMTLVVAVGVPGAAGGLLLKAHFGEGKRLAGGKDLLKRQTQEAEMLRIAADHEGKLAVVDVVRELAMGQEEAESVLKGMVLRGAAEIEVTESGLLVYTFPDLNLLGEKSTSRGVLDD